MHHYLGLRHVEHTAYDVQEYMVDVHQTAREMAAAMRENVRTRNPSACFRYGACPFLDHCLSRIAIDSEPTRWIKAASAMPELSDSIVS